MLPHAPLHSAAPIAHAVARMTRAATPPCSPARLRLLGSDKQEATHSTPGPGEGAAWGTPGMGTDAGKKLGMRQECLLTTPTPECRSWPGEKAKKDSGQQRPERPAQGTATRAFPALPALAGHRMRAWGQCKRPAASWGPSGRTKARQTCRGAPQRPQPCGRGQHRRKAQAFKSHAAPTSAVHHCSPTHVPANYLVDKLILNCKRKHKGPRTIILKKNKLRDSCHQISMCTIKLCN